MAGPNSEQEELWNSGPGRSWVRRQADLDLLMEAVSGRLLVACAPQRGERVLDVGCGAGASSFALAAAVGPAGRIVGLDISEPLLSLAESRGRELASTNVVFVLSDAQTDMKLEPASYDLVASRFGMMFFADPVAAFRNLAGLLRPGGRMVFVAWAGPEHNPWFAIPQQAAVARLGPVAQAAPDAPGPMAFRDVQPVLERLEQAGLTGASAEAVDLSLTHPGGLDAMVSLCEEVGPLPRVMRDKGGNEKDLAAILEDIRRSFAGYATGGGINIPARVLIYSARVGDGPRPGTK